MTKRMFQIFDDMNVADEINKTAFLGCCYDFVSADKSKAGIRVTMGAPAEAMAGLMNDDTQPVLILLNRNEYFRRKKQPDEEGALVGEAMDEYWRKAMSQLERTDLGDIGRKNWEKIRDKAKAYLIKYKQ